MSESDVKARKCDKEEAASKINNKGYEQSESSATPDFESQSGIFPVTVCVCYQRDSFIYFSFLFIGLEAKGDQD